jgi:hypothetical protein
VQWQHLLHALLRPKVRINLSLFKPLLRLLKSHGRVNLKQGLRLKDNMPCGRSKRQPKPGRPNHHRLN